MMMDPEVALARLRKAVEELEFVLPGPDIVLTTHVEDAAAEVVEAFQDLDGWLSTGGFPPAGWGSAEKRS